MSLGEIMFFLLGAIAIVSALGVILHPHPVYSALCLVIALFQIAALFILLDAQMVAFLQVIVYAGAIMVLFLFVIMLLNLGAEGLLKEPGGLQAPTAGVLGIVFLTVLMAAGAMGGGLPASQATAQTLADGGTVETVGKALFNAREPWLFPFEVTSILLLVGVVGAIILAKRKI